MTPLTRQRLVILAVLAFFAYTASYLYVRTLHVRRSKTDATFSIVFPESQRWLAGVYRPLSLLDAASTGVKTRIESPP